MTDLLINTIKSESECCNENITVSGVGSYKKKETVKRI